MNRLGFVAGVAAAGVAVPIVASAAPDVVEVTEFWYRAPMQVDISEMAWIKRTIVFDPRTGETLVDKTTTGPFLDSESGEVDLL